jgi:hypothetical protein
MVKAQAARPSRLFYLLFSNLVSSKQTVSTTDDQSIIVHRHTHDPRNDKQTPISTTRPKRHHRNLIAQNRYRTDSSTSNELGSSQTI